MTMTKAPMTKVEFEAAMDAAGIFNLSEPRVEQDGEFAYDCFDNADGEEVGFITYRSGEILGYTIHER